MACESLKLSMFTFGNLKGGFNLANFISYSVDFYVVNL